MKMTDLENEYNDLIQQLFIIRKRNNYKESTEENEHLHKMDVVWKKMIDEERLLFQ